MKEKHEDVLLNNNINNDNNTEKTEKKLNS